MTNIFAYTAPGCNYPEYVSLNVADDGSSILIVRSKAKEDGSCGDTAQIALDADKLAEFARTLYFRSLKGFTSGGDNL